MKLPVRLVSLLASFGRRLEADRKPDVIIGAPSDPYLLRWWVIPRNPVFNIYYHVVKRPDDDRALHDDPWVNASIVLEGGYMEVLPANEILPPVRTRRLWRPPGSVVVRGAHAAHRLELRVRFPKPVGDYVGTEHIEARTLFITGPRLRRWGFWCPKGWRHWKDFCGVDADGRNNGQVGRGCGE